MFLKATVLVNRNHGMKCAPPVSWKAGLQERLPDLLFGASRAPDWLTTHPHGTGILGPFKYRGEVMLMEKNVTARRLRWITH